MSLDAPLSNPSEADLGNAVQENLYALFKAMAHGFRFTGTSINRYLWRNG